MAIKTAKELATAAESVAKNYKTLYVMGCFGAPLTAKNKTRYTTNHDYNKDATRTAMIEAASEDTFGFDCVCLIKGLLWGWNGDKSKTYGGASYASNGVPDIGADSMITKCTELSTDFSNIEVGEAVWMKGHIGIYIGNGLAVECTPKWNNCVQITACNCTKSGYNRRNWTKHGKLPYVTYEVEKPKETVVVMEGTYAKGVKTKLSANFSSTEFDCHGSGCCKETVIDPKLVDILQKIRTHFGKAVTVTSGYRCPTHNSKVSKATKSKHTMGQAADITVKGVTPREVAQYAESIGIKGIGLYETDKDGHFVHVDTRTTKSFWYGQSESPMTTFGATSNSKPVTVANADKVIWDTLKGKGLNDFAIAGIMGNLYAESALKPTNLQNTYEKSLGYTDDAYTAAVDNGSYTNFVRDSAGYGLAQWTYWSRKQNLLNYAKSVGKSIGDLGMQIEFLWTELQGYKKVMTVLNSAKSIKEASDIVLTEFERPANMGDSVKEKRASYGQQYYDKYASATQVETPAEPAPVKEKKATEPARSFENSLTGKYKVTAKGGLYLRNGAGTNKAAMCIMPFGTVVQNYGYYTSVGGTSWLYVVATVKGYKYTGFCSSKYLAKQ